MTPFKVLRQIYGIAAYFTSTRLLHERVSQLEMEKALLEQKLEGIHEEHKQELAQRDSNYRELQERVFIRKENLLPVKDTAPPIKIPKQKASRVRELIAQKKREESQYYALLSETSPEQQ
jgi:hypothetical protein